MSEHQRDPIVHDAMANRASPRLRWLLVGLLSLLAISLVATGVAVWYALDQRERAAQAGLTLAERIQAACEAPFEERPDAVIEDPGLCDDADQVVKDAPDAIVAGPRGSRGAQGPEGPAGPQGNPGRTSPRGPAGEDGDNGTDGRNGPAGEDGTNGDPGMDGADGATGPVGPTGPQGEQGAVGPQGERGEPGVQGEPGQSAYPFTFTFTIPAAPPIQEDRTYAVTCRPDGCTVTPQ